MKTRLNKACNSSACRIRMLTGFCFSSHNLSSILAFILALAFQSQAIAALKNTTNVTANNKTIGKILSLDLCTDWMLAKYADPTQVLALSPLVHQYPVNWMTRKWPGHDGSLEQILKLKPDLVLTGEYNAVILRRRLQELGLHVEILPLPKNFSDVGRYEQRFLSLIGKSVRETNKLPQTKPGNRSRPKLLLLGPNGIGTGRNTFEDGLLQYTGWDNYLTSEGYSNLDLEQIVTHPPDAIHWSTPDSAAQANLFAKHPVLKQVISKKRWIKTEDWRWHCPGPWSRDLIKQLQTQLIKSL